MDMAAAAATIGETDGMKRALAARAMLVEAKKKQREGERMMVYCEEAARQITRERERAEQLPGMSAGDKRELGQLVARLQELTAWRVRVAEATLSEAYAQEQAAEAEIHSLSVGQ